MDISPTPINTDRCGHLVFGLRMNHRIPGGAGVRLPRSLTLRRTSGPVAAGTLEQFPQGLGLLQSQAKEPGSPTGGGRAGGMWVSTEYLWTRDLLAPVTAVRALRGPDLGARSPEGGVPSCPSAEPASGGVALGHM